MNWYGSETAFRNLRQRKDEIGGKDYAGGMQKDFNKLAQTTVADFLSMTPNANRVFMDFHTSCIGCRLSRFCTLNEVVEAYKLESACFFEELSKHLVSNLTKENSQ